MNINYLRLDRIPRFDEGWQPVLDALRGGQVLRHAPARSWCASSPSAASRAARRWRWRRASGPRSGSTLDWTFPLRFAEVVSGDGTKVYRERIDLADTGPFGRADPDPHARPDGPEVGPRRGLGRRGERGVHPAGLARSTGRGPRAVEDEDKDCRDRLESTRRAIWRGFRWASVSGGAWSHGDSSSVPHLGRQADGRDRNPPRPHDRPDRDAEGPVRGRSECLRLGQHVALLRGRQQAQARRCPTSS